MVQTISDPSHPVERPDVYFFLILANRICLKPKALCFTHILFLVLLYLLYLPRETVLLQSKCHRSKQMKPPSEKQGMSISTYLRKQRNKV